MIATAKVVQLDAETMASAKANAYQTNATVASLVFGFGIAVGYDMMKEMTTECSTFYRFAVATSILSIGLSMFSTSVYAVENYNVNKLIGQGHPERANDLVAANGTTHNLAKFGLVVSILLLFASLMCLIADKAGLALKVFSAFFLSFFVIGTLVVTGMQYRTYRRLGKPDLDNSFGLLSDELLEESED
mmetsp:Transcript_110706/g.191884  ORF Transcript_110706/g.191884 Transcript_110706/m.191884 type:complete len:189 (+) Transcript_110706:117-683(+)